MDLGKIGNFIATLRKKKNLTQAELGERLGVTSKSVSKWEQGVCAPNISILNQLSEELGITTTELLKGERVNVNEDDDIDDRHTKNIGHCYCLVKNGFTKIFVILILIMISLFILIMGFFFL